MPNQLQAIRFDHPTNPHGLHGCGGLNCHPRIQFDDGDPRQRLLFPLVRHRTYLRENRHREDIHKIRRFDVVHWRRNGILWNVFALVRLMKRSSRWDGRWWPAHYVSPSSFFSFVCIWRFSDGCGHISLIVFAQLPSCLLNVDLLFH